MKEIRASHRLDTTRGIEALDELANLCRHWQAARERMITPEHIGSAIEMSCKEIARRLDAPVLHLQRYDRMSARSVSESELRIFPDHRYLVTTRANDHVAFRTRAAFIQWLDLRGLHLRDECPPEGVPEMLQIIGFYNEVQHLSYAEFFALADDALHVRVLSNAQWTLGLITTDEDACRTVHTLNSNLAYRPRFDAQESLVLQDRGEIQIRSKSP